MPRVPMTRTTRLILYTLLVYILLMLTLLVIKFIRLV